jgi:hypothetical protein
MEIKDVEGIVELLRRWKHRPLRWDRLQEKISVILLNGDKPWSRQSLQANERIKVAWSAAKRRLAGREGRAYDTENTDASAIERLEIALAELQTRYENLAIRHRQLMYNAAMLPGGTRLLLDPLPDNTPMQKTGTGQRHSSHR